MTLFRIAAALLAFSSPAVALAGDAVSPLGSWQLSTGESRYDVVSCGKNSICAKLTWLRADARTEENLELLNKFVVKGSKVSATKWKGTAVYEGDTVDASMTFIDENTIRVTGCSLFCKTMELSRIGGTVALR